MTFLTLLASISTVSVFAFGIIRFLGGSTFWLYFSFSFVVIAVITLLTRLFILLPRIEWNTNRGLVKSELLTMRGHLIFHVLIFGYIFTGLNREHSISLDLFFYIPIFTFFITGAQTWKILYQRFNSVIYKIFFRGNTGMLIVPTLIFILGYWLNSLVLIESYRRVLSIYFLIHLLLVGMTVVKIERQIGTRLG